jgi:serine/threonine protein kinase
MAAASSTAPKALARPFGRFELRRVLGEGAQATVWLGFDQRLEREVAIKLMHSDASVDPVAVGEWLREARSVSRLTHPNIVPVFEADVFERQPYLVFEYVPGPTLAQLAKSRGALPAHEAVGLILGVLDALQAAHAAGVVHRDLKPSNVLVASAGRARVMDFGIAGRLHDPSGREEIVGTPGYMSPEATRGSLPTAAMDLFSVGVMLAELLSGEKLVAERDPHQAMRRVATEDLRLPANLSSEVDDVLRTIIRKGLEREPERRWQSAVELRVALQDWLAPAAAADEPAAPSGGGAGSGTLDFLLRRMRHKSDFPALSDSVARIQQVANSESKNVSSLSGEILKDVALTNKLLRLVNTASYSTSAGGISTVSRAVALVGFNNIRNMALSLVLLEHMHDKAHAAHLKEEFLRSLLAGMLASELGTTVPGSEEAYLGALFQNLGRLLTAFYFPEEARQVRGIVAGSGTPGETRVSDATASVRVLGLSFETLGLGVAKTWGLPATLQACMRTPPGDPPTRPPADGTDRLRWLTDTANRIADTLLQAEPEHAASEVAAVAKRYAKALGVSPEQIQAASTSAREKLSQAVDAMCLQVPKQSPARRLFASPPAAPATDIDFDLPTLREDATHTARTVAAAAAADATVREARDSSRTLTMARPASAPASASAEDACAVLTAGIEDITTTLIDTFRLDDVLRMILETMYRALAFRHVVFCLRDIKSGALTGRFGFGEGVEAITSSFKVPLKGSTDLFSAVCAKGADVFIADTRAASIASRLPPWYVERVNAPSFLLLPVFLGGAPLGLIYADRDKAGGSDLGERELSLLRTLRNQALMAFKQAS